MHNLIIFLLFVFLLQYNQTCPIQKKDPSYRKDPLLGDQVHCVVYVINCRQLSLLTEQLLMKYRNVRAHISTKSKKYIFQTKTLMENAE